MDIEAGHDRSGTGTRPPKKRSVPKGKDECPGKKKPSVDKGVNVRVEKGVEKGVNKGVDKPGKHPHGMDEPENGHPKDIPLGRFLSVTSQNMIILIIAAFIPMILVRWSYNVSPDTYGGIQEFETAIVYHLSRALDIPVTRVAYNGLDVGLTYTLSWGNKPLQVAPDCTGVQEMVFMAGMVLGFVGPRLKTRVIWAIILAGVMFVENIIRLMLNYTLLERLGENGWSDVHIFWWQYGQLMVVMAIFVTWYWLVARREIALLRGEDTGKGPISGLLGRLRKTPENQ